VNRPNFEWDENKNTKNIKRHSISFNEAQFAFADPKKIIALGLDHSKEETRYYCFGKFGGGILTVRFTYRNGVISIFGAGYWRKGRQIHEKGNRIH
jgi:uncharacterized DUF497 family protein